MVTSFLITTFFFFFKVKPEDSFLNQGDTEAWQVRCINYELLLTSALHECSHKSHELFEYTLALAVKLWAQNQSFNEYSKIVSFSILNM